jgi:hypothetical protein
MKWVQNVQIGQWVLTSVVRERVRSWVGLACRWTAEAETPAAYEPLSPEGGPLEAHLFSEEKIKLWWTLPIHDHVHINNNSQDCNSQMLE